ncbi:MAG: transporter substrate-binding domain-containing protein [Desulfobacteraceae bacterium]|jgi:polar amino acid transport system substrate-binding protein
MKHGRIPFLILTLSVLTPFFAGGNQARALAAESQTIRMGYIEFTPVFYTDADGVPQGLLVDLARKVVPAAGYQLKMESLPVKRMANSLIKGEIDLWAGLKTIEGFEGNTFAGDSILLQICLNAYSLGEVPSISKKEDLNQKMIIGLRGFSYGGWVAYLKDPANEIDFVEVGSHESALKVLERNNNTGTKCFLLDYEQPVNKALQTYPVAKLKKNPINCLDAYFVVSKKTPNAETVLHRLESTYKKLKKQGKVE